MARTRKPAEPSTMDVHAATPENRPIHAGGKSIEGLATLQAEVYQRVGRRVPDSEAVQLQSFKTDSFRDKMAARSRPRNGAIKEDPADAHEELSMWDQIEKDIKKCSAIQKRCREVSKQIVEMEEKMGKPTTKEIDELQALYRENVKLAEEEYRMLNEEPADLIKNLGILRALRTASEKEPVRSTGPSKSRKPKPAAPKIEMDGAADSPGPSPSVSNPAARLKGSSARSGSVVSTRDLKEIPIKMEDGGAEGTKGPSAERAGKFFVGALVAYKQAKMKEDGSQWIQCNIVAITEVGNKKRYEVQDPEPEENGAPGQVYKASAAALIAIPPEDAILPDHPVGKHVLARYPETTTFYRAEVTGTTKGGCRLKFEDDQNQEMEVDRRFVLDVSNK